jgi:hypothetical protein
MTLIKTFFLISILFCSCDFSKGVKEDVQKNMISHKAFIQSLSFSGQIVEKKFCEKCNVTKYQIIINFKEINPKNITIGNQNFQPYYFFDVNNRLNISVVKDLYESAEKGLAIEKQSNSDHLIVRNQKYKLISNEEYKWLPN